MRSEIPSIDEMPCLVEKLDKGTLAKIRYYQRGTGVKPLRAKPVKNELMQYLQGLKFSDLTSELQNIFVGGCRVATGNKPLDPDQLLACFQSIENFHTFEIQRMLDCTERNARRYFQAIKIIQPFLIRMFEKKYKK